MKDSYGRVKGITIESIYKTLSKKNQNYISEFVKWKKGSITEKRLLMIKNSLIKFGDLLELDFDKATKTEITIAWNIIYACKELAIKSKQDDFMHIRQGFKHWFGDDEEYPREVRGMKRPSQKGTLRLPKKMPTEEDIDDMIKKCRNPRDKFWVSYCGLDSAIRPCEARALRWKDLIKDEYGYYFIVRTAKESGDTENRSIRVINSEPYLFEWMKAYPGKRDDNNFIFCRLDNPKLALDDGAITSLFKRLRKRINFNGKFSAYTLRHACLTRLSKNPKVAQAILKKMAGHSKNSNVIAEYQHFGDEDILEMNLVASGKKDVKRDFELKNKPIKCPHCKTSNPHDAEVCGKCNFALSQKRVVNNEDLQKKVLELTEKIDGLLDGGYEKEMEKIYEQFEKKRKEKAK
jgi:integrase/ribosomal protein L40E